MLFPNWQGCSNNTVTNTVKRFEETGSVADRKKELPTPVRTGSTEARVLQAVARFPKDVYASHC